MPLTHSPVIIGAGVAGLAMAVGWRQRHGVTPLLCERQPSQAAEGFGFLLLPPGQDALRSLGVDLEAELDPQPIDHVRLISTTGLLLAEHALASGAMALERSQLLRALRARMDTAQIRSGCLFEGVRLSDGRVQAVCFRNSQALPVSILFGADGAVSRTRRALLERPSQPWMPGRVARVQEVVAIVENPELADRLGRGLLKVLDPAGGLAVGLLPLSRGRLVWFAQFDTLLHRQPVRGAELPFLLELLSGFPSWLRDLIAATDPSLPHHWRPLDLDPPARLVGPNLALLGDAAHPLLPFTKIGRAHV